ncbi:MAG: hypothetical protein Q8P32_01335 [Candidatus Komeilibacteria bacterium]|nr:hypothetical protein [Candidatus Komeilibacteria bacterium]
MDTIYGHIEAGLRQRGLWERAWQSVEDHAPLWHEHPLFIHIAKTILAAKIVLKQTQSAGAPIDLRIVMALHDIEKIPLFILYCQQPKLPGRLTYPDHEQQSARKADRRGFDAETVFLIRWHGLRYSGIKPENLIAKYGSDRDWLAKLMLVWACDVYGLGSNPKQLAESPAQIALIKQIAEQADLPDYIAPICSRLMLAEQS